MAIRVALTIAALLFSWHGGHIAVADPDQELRDAREALLSKLPDNQRDIAERLSSKSPPRLNVGVGDQLVKGRWGEIEWSDSVTRTRGVVENRIVVHRDYTVTIPRQDFRVDEVIDKDNMLIHDFRVWIEGLSTENVAEDDRIEMAGRIFEVRGTKRYDTVAGGSRTVKHLAAIDVGPAKEAAIKLIELSAYRAWKDDAGKFAVAARFLEFKAGSVSLQRLDGKLITVPMNRLSRADQKWVRDEVKRSKAKAKAAAAR